MTILGIDPGAQGAVTVLNESGALLEIHDMPVTLEPNGRHAVNAPLLASIMARAHARVAYCGRRAHSERDRGSAAQPLPPTLSDLGEFVGARPTDAKTAAFSFGRARGCIEGVAGALGLPIRFLTPPTWKRSTGVPPGGEAKDTAGTIAIARWPTRRSLRPQMRRRSSRSVL